VSDQSVMATATQARGKNPGRAQNSDPQTGKPLAGLRSDIEDSFLADRVKVDNNAPFTPVRVWTAGPSLPADKIVIPGDPRGLRPALDGAYYCKTPIQLATLKRCVGKNRMWFDDLDEDEPDLVCGACQWHCRSNRAMNYHLNQAHGREQAQ
jgi:hypothetical protein